MFAHTAAVILLTMDIYLLMDSVVVDLDDPEQAYLPRSLEWTKGFDGPLLSEFLDVVQNTPWVLQKHVPKENFTMYSHRSKAYGDRRIYFSKSLLKASVSEVVDMLYLKSRLHDSWCSEWAASKIAEYGGRNKYVLWYQSQRALGGLMPPRDFVSYTVKMDCGPELASAVRNPRELSSAVSWPATNRGQGKPNQVDEPVVSDHDGRQADETEEGLEACRRMGPVVILYTNSSHSDVDYPERDGVERGGLGTSGYYIQGISSDPPVTFVGMLVNVDFKPPGVVPENPDILLNRVFVAKGMSIFKESTAHLRRLHLARKSPNS